MISDHGLIQIGLERLVSPLTKTVITEITFQAFYHSLNRGAATHDRLESFCHGRIVRIDVRQGIKRNRYGASRLCCTVTALSSFRAADTDGRAMILLGRFIDEFLAVVPNAFVVQLITGDANGYAIGGNFLYATRQIVRNGL